MLTLANNQLTNSSKTFTVSSTGLVGTSAVTLTVVYDFGATLLVMYLLAIALTGWLGKHLRKELRALAGVIGLFSASLHPIPVAVGLATVIFLKFFGKKL